MRIEIDGVEIGMQFGAQFADMNMQHAVLLADIDGDFQTVAMRGHVECIRKNGAFVGADDMGAAVDYSLRRVDLPFAECPGVLPLALIETTGSELHRPLAVVYIGGFFFAILLRLIIVPALYCMLMGMKLGEVS